MKADVVEVLEFFVEDGVSLEMFIKLPSTQDSACRRIKRCRVKHLGNEAEKLFNVSRTLIVCQK